nr:4527_t:CDS:2 [Entrophospora candida]
MFLCYSVISFVFAIIVIVEEEVRTKPRIRAGIYDLKENEEIKENEMGIEINQLEENKEIEATNLEKKSKEDNSNSGLALEATVVSLDVLEGYEDDTQVPPEVEAANYHENDE